MNNAINRILVAVAIGTGLLAGPPGCVSGRMPWTATTVEERFQDVVAESARINRKYHNQFNALTLAIFQNDTELALFIIANHPQYVTMLDTMGSSALYDAVNARNIPVMRALLKAGALKVRGKSSPLVCAVNKASMAAHFEKAEEPKCLLMVHELLAAGADVNAFDSDGISPLFAARNAHLAAILIAHGADVNAKQPKRGVTPLYWATDDGDVARVKLLLDHGADPNRRDCISPLACARHNGNREIIALLEADMRRRPPGGK